MVATDFQGMLSGVVEADEAYIGGKRRGKTGRGAAGKTIVVGVKERGGPVKAVVVPNAKTESLRKVVNAAVEKGSYVNTDEWQAYSLLKGDGYKHGKIKHRFKQWARMDRVHNIKVSTNGIENFWKQLKTSIRSTHVSVSSQHMPKYLGEFTFRANHRQEVNAMFDRLIAKF